MQPVPGQCSDKPIAYKRRSLSRTAKLQSQLFHWLQFPFQKIFHWMSRSGTWLTGNKKYQLRLLAFWAPLFSHFWAATHRHPCAPHQHKHERDKQASSSLSLHSLLAGWDNIFFRLRFGQLAGFSKKQLRSEDRDPELAPTQDRCSSLWKSSTIKLESAEQPA